MNSSSWFHCILTTYGAWLPGDPRGFRTRHHREYVEGDYKNPPPQGIYEGRLARSKQLQKYPTVMLPKRERGLLGRRAVRHVKERGVELLSMAMGGQHLHVQMKCDKDRVIAMLGDVKRALWYERRVMADGCGARGGRLFRSGTGRIRRRCWNTSSRIARRGRGSGVGEMRWSELAVRRRRRTSGPYLRPLDHVCQWP
jgi:hypothetical protein